MKIKVKEKNPSSDLIEEWTFSFWFGGDSGHLLLDGYRCGTAKIGRIRPLRWAREYSRNARTGLSDDVPPIPESVIEKARTDLLRQLRELPVVKRL
jgi:hypothetical protein